MAEQSAREFGEHLAALFVAAGSPTLTAVATSVGRGRRAASVTPQRLSDWRRGRHLPKDFATVAPVLVWLTARAVAGDPAVSESTLTLPDWERLWQRVAAADDPQVENAAAPAPVRDPFRGLAPFTESDSAMYFGRESLVDELVDTICRAERARVESHRNGIVIVTGMSGAGKSSLLAAGIAGSDRVAVRRRTRPAPPGDGLDVPAPPPSPAVDVDQTDVVPVVAIDQFEDLFARPADDQVDYIARITALATTVVVVIAVRADHFESCVRHPALAAAWAGNCVIVGEMTDAQLRSVIVEPARAVGVRVEPGLPDLMIGDIHRTTTSDSRAGQLPLLAHVLRATWNRRSNGRMTVAAYRATGGPAQAVADTAEQAWHSIAPAQHADARAVLLSLMHLGPGGRHLRIPVPRTVLHARTPSASQIIDVFADARLLTVGENDVEFIHDTVLTAWPRLRRWIDDDRDAHAARQRLEQAASEWDANDRHRTYLYSGGRLAIEQKDIGGLVGTLSDDGSRFLRASRRHHRTVRGVQFAVAAIVVVLAVASTVTAGVAITQKHTLAAERDELGYRSLRAVIDKLATADPPLAQQFLLSAHRLRPDDDEVTSMILATDNVAVPMALTGHAGAVYDVVFNRTGTMMASAGEDHSARLWDVSDHRSPRVVSVLSGHEDFLTSVAFDPVRPVLATSSGDGSVRLWDIADPAHPDMIGPALRGGPGAVYNVAFSPDGAMLAVPGDDGAITLWDVSDPTRPVRRQPPLRGHAGAVRAVTFSPDGRILASSGDDRTARLWDMSSPSAHAIGAPITGFPAATHSVAFSRNGTELAVVENAANAQLWDVADPVHPRLDSGALPGTTAGSWSVAFDPVGDGLAAADGDGAVRMWNVVAPTRPMARAPLSVGPPGAAKVFAVAYSPDGSHLAAAGADGTIRLWALPAAVHDAHGGRIESLAVAANGESVATLGADARLTMWHRAGSGPMNAVASTALGAPPIRQGVVAMTAAGDQLATTDDVSSGVTLWQTQSGGAPQRVGNIPTATRYVHEIAYAPGRHLLATADDDRSVAIWDTTDPHRPRRLGEALRGPTDLVDGLAIEPTGRYVAVSSVDRRVRIYDLTRPQAGVVAVVDIDASPGTDVTFDPSGRILAVAAGRVGLWRVDDGGSLTVLARIGEPDGGAATVTISPHGTTMLVGSADGLTAVDITDPTKPVPQGDSVVPRSAEQLADGAAPGRWHAAFTSDGQVIAGGAPDGTLRVLEADPAASVQRLCVESGRPLTAAMWRRLLPAVAYRAPC